jgi:hypothetical protein
MAILRERKRKILATYETGQAEAEARNTFHDAAAQVRPPAKIAGRYLAPYLATARPPSLSREPLVDRTPSASDPAPGREDALELSLLMADEEARAGDLRQALHALDAALALSGGVLPQPYAARRTEWQHELTKGAT